MVAHNGSRPYLIHAMQSPLKEDKGLSASDMFNYPVYADYVLRARMRGATYTQVVRRLLDQWLASHMK